jgi:hypothetical protein
MVRDPSAGGTFTTAVSGVLAAPAFNINPSSHSIIGVKKYAALVSGLFNSGKVQITLGFSNYILWVHRKFHPNFTPAPLPYNSCAGNARWF